MDVSGASSVAQSAAAMAELLKVAQAMTMENAVKMIKAQVATETLDTAQQSTSQMLDTYA